MYPMKNLKTGILCLLFVISCIFANAQSLPVREPDLNKPSLFLQLPERMNINIANLENMLQNEMGRQVSFTLAANFTFEGTVSSVASKYENTVNSIVIRSTNLQGAVLTLSKISRGGGTSYFVGRIISFQHGDGYEINFENGQYYFVKKGLYDMINE